MKHPEGRLLAVQQQIHFAALFGDNSGIGTEHTLNLLAQAGMRLVSDESEIAVDAAAVFPKLQKDKAGLKLV